MKNGVLLNHKKQMIGEAEIGNLLKTLQDREHEKSILLSVGNKIAAARKREDLWNILTTDILALFGGLYYTLCLLNEDGKTHSPFLHSQEKKIESRGNDNPIIHISHPINDGIFNQALFANQPIIFCIDKLIQNQNVVPYILKWNKIGVKEMIVVKICNGNEARGVLYIYAEQNGAFSTEKFDLLTGIADQLGTGICNVLANEKIEQQLKQINNYKQQLEEENLYLQEEVKSNNNFSEIIGTGYEMQKVFKLVSQVANADATVLLLGETGTGKELIARAIHNASPRKGKLMIKVNCAALPAELIESALFGHERGSFTGALERRLGKFELANNSTLFLDEIGELPLELQVKLLRALQEKEIERVGGQGSIKVNVRIIAATNRNLQKEVDAGKFRSDLFYRLNVFPITLPPLRKRKEDIPTLVSYFINQYSKNAGKKIKQISNNVLDNLVEYAWPGNVRELEHLIERNVLMTTGSIIKKIDLPTNNSIKSKLPEEEFVIKKLDEMEREYILKVVKICGGRISGINGAAVKLGLPSTTLISRMQKLQIKKGHFVDASLEN